MKQTKCNCCIKEDVCNIKETYKEKTEQVKGCIELYKDNIEVIGNIHNNPELLGERI